jgi:hypothetical protein
VAAGLMMANGEWRAQSSTRYSPFAIRCSKMHAIKSNAPQCPKIRT